MRHQGSPEKQFIYKMVTEIHDGKKPTHKHTWHWLDNYMHINILE